MSRRSHDEADEPGTGTIRDRTAADPHAALHPSAREGTSAHTLTQSRGARSMGSGDARPPVLRPGSTVAATLPSRTGRTLRWPDGRVTPLDA